jgi:hypothetical protein
MHFDAMDGTAGSTIGTCVSGDDCSVMTLSLSEAGSHSIYVVASNPRGTVRKEYTFTAHYCGCTDPFDANYWPVATYVLPTECTVESWTGAADIVEMGTVQYYQFYYEESTHEVELTLRVDTGAVDLLVSPDGLPEVGVSTSYLAAPYSTTAVSNFKVASIPFSQLSGKRSLYIALNGVEKFSRFNLLAHKKDFTTSRSMLADSTLTTVTTPVLTNRYNFYEFALSVAPNDIDVEIITTVTTGTVTVYTSQTERYPSPLRAATSENGYDMASASTAAGSIATIVQTIRPDEDRVLYISVRSDASTVAAGATSSSTVNVGASPGESTYTIKATIYRYKIQSELLDLVVDSSTNSNGVAVVVGSGGVDSVGTAGESTRYTEVSEGNFNYYEVQCNTNAASLTVTVTLNSGNVQVYHSDTKLPTRDTTIGHTAKYPSTSVAWTTASPSTLTIPISFSMINKNSLKVYLGVYGLATSSYSIAVAETALAGASSTPVALDFSTAITSAAVESIDSGTANTVTLAVIDESIVAGQVLQLADATGLTCSATPKGSPLTVASIAGRVITFTTDLTAGDGSASSNCVVTRAGTYGGTRSVSLTANTYYFMAIPVGQVDTAMYVRRRSGAGSRTADAITGAAVESIDSGTANTVTLAAFDASIVAGQILQLADATGLTCSATPKGSSLTVDSVVGRVIKFTTDLTAGDGSASSNCVVTRAGTSTDASAWGLDWYDTLTSTWQREHEDEHDLDVTLTLTVTTATAISVYGSSREVYVSPERGYDVTATLAVGATETFSIPHYTFGDQVVYVSLLSAGSQTVEFTLAKAEKAVPVSTDTTATANTCSTLSSCSGHGSCVYDNGEESCYCVDGYTGSDCSVPEFRGSDALPANPNLVLPTVVMGKAVSNGAIANAFDESVAIVFPYEVRSAPAYSKVLIRVDGKPYPDRVSGVVHIGASGTPVEGALTYYSVDVIGLATGVNHEIQFYLVAASGRLLDVVQLQFQTMRSGGCVPDANGNPCSSNGLCQDGYCICYDGFIGTDCSIVDSTQGSATNGEASYTSPGASFVPTGAHKTYKTMEAANKKSKASMAHTMGLAATNAELTRITTELTAKGIATKTKIEAELDSVAATVAANKAARAVTVAALHRKLDANAAAIQQDVLSSERSKTAALEAHIETQRTLFEHQTAVNKGFDSKKAAMAANMAAKLAMVTQDMAEARFRINNLVLNNGPAVKPSELTKNECTTDQFNNVVCVDTALTTAEQDAFVTESVGTSATAADDWERGR